MLDKIKKFNYNNFIKENEIDELNIYSWEYNLKEYFQESGFFLYKEYHGNDIDSYTYIFIFKEKSFEKNDVYANPSCPDFKTEIGQIKEISGDIKQYIGDFSDNTSVSVFAF